MTDGRGEIVRLTEKAGAKAPAFLMCG